jgi:NAD(P)-dependent dehydrogenase (short-subunit alcohol dehydrogenase family)
MSGVKQDHPVSPHSTGRSISSSRQAAMSDSVDRKVWFITGANRGIGLGLVRHILEESEQDIVFAGTRDPAKSDALNKLATDSEGRLFVLQLSSESEEQAKAAARIVKDKVGHLDIVIANAGELEVVSQRVSLGAITEYLRLQVLPTISDPSPLLHYTNTNPTGASIRSA